MRWATVSRPLMSSSACCPCYFTSSGLSATGAAVLSFGAAVSTCCLVPVAPECRDCGADADVLRFSNSAISFDASPLVSSKTKRVMASPSL